MSSKKTTTTTPNAPVKIPNAASQPAVAEVRRRLDTIHETASATRKARETAERQLGANPGVSDETIEARLMAKGQPTDALDQLRELRRKEVVVNKAAEFVAAELKTATEQAERELTPLVREQLFLPAARAAVADWLEAAGRLEAFRMLVSRIQDNGVGSGTFSPFNFAVPVSRADEAALRGFVLDLIRDGFADADQVEKVFPALLSSNQ